MLQCFGASTYNLAVQDMCTSGMIKKSVMIRHPHVLNETAMTGIRSQVNQNERDKIKHESS